MKTPVLRFWWEWKAGSPFWPGDDAARDLFGLGEIQAADLELPLALIEEIDATAAWHDTALNWNYPPDPGPWRQDECDRFNSMSKLLFERCQKALAGRFDLLYDHSDIIEDPDLDAYLANPKNFKRN